MRILKMGPSMNHEGRLIRNMQKLVQLLDSHKSSYGCEGRQLAAAAMLLVTFAFCRPAAADARFDLTGPKVNVRVTRAGMTLPIAEVPNLQPGDRLWVQADLPATQSVHYLMVVSFLRGTTNPPPENWFIRVETWDKKVREEGSEITVPDGAQQAVLFLAPVTGGDFGTLRSAVQGRPGIFVRAANDLDLAGFEQARIEKYIASMREVPQAELSDAKALQEHSNVIAGTLALKPNGDCVKLPPDQQYTCLTQSGNQTLLDDGHGQSIVTALSSGAGSDFINQASYTGLAGAGQYSAYVGAVVDLVRLMGSLHTAQYQYIPAIVFPDGDSLNLRLNTAPSFHNPKSVIVIGLPSIQGTSAPPLRPSDPKLVSCLAKPGLVLQVAGAPLVFSTGFAHDVVLHINYPDGAGAGKPQDLPLTADAFRGGLIVAAPSPARRSLPIEKVTLPRAVEPEAAKKTEPEQTKPSEVAGAPELTGTVEGYWGFDTFKGPTMPLENTPGQGWKVMSQDPLIAGKDAHVALSASGTACVDNIELETGASPKKATWKAGDQPKTLEVSLDLSSVASQEPQTVRLAIRQFGAAKADTVSVVSYAAAAKLNALIYHAGDTRAVLKGTSLAEVKQVKLDDAAFVPVKDQQNSSAAAVSASAQGESGSDAIEMQLGPAAKPPKVAAGESETAKVTLKDGRVLPVSVQVELPRPAVELISKAEVEPKGASSAGNLAVHLGSQNDLPLSNTILFALKSERAFPRGAKVEVASADGSLHTMLSLDNATLVLEDPKTVLGKLEPLKSFGPSAFGPIQVRAIAPDGTAGDWIPLTTLVRVPTLTGLDCPVAPAASAASASQSNSVVPPTSAPQSSAADSQGAPGGAASGASAQQGTDSDAAAGAANIAPQAASGTPSTVDAIASAQTTGEKTAPGSQAATTAAACTLSGSDLFLVDAVGTDPALANATHVPDGYVDTTLSVAAPSSGMLYLRLRDDPTVIDSVAVPQPAPPATPVHSQSKRPKP